MPSSSPSTRAGFLSVPRPIARLCALTVCSLLVITGSLGPAHAINSSAAAAPLDLSHTRTPLSAVDDSQAVEAPGEQQLIVSPDVPVFEDEAANYEFSVLLRNTTGDPLPSGTIQLTLETDRVTQLSVASSKPLEPARVFANTVVDETEAESEQAVTIRVPREDFPLTTEDEEGVYRVQAALISALDKPVDEEPGAETPATDKPHDTETALQLLDTSIPLVWMGVGESAPLTVGSVVPLVLPAEILTMPTRPQLDESVVRFDDLITFAEQHRATLAIDPRIIVGIRAYGTDAPAAAVDLLDRLTTTRAPSYLLQFADADPSAQADLGLKELLQPVNFDFVTRHGKFSPLETPPPGSKDAAQSPSTQPGTAKDTEAAEEPPATDQPDVQPKADATPSAEPDPAAEDDTPDHSPTLTELVAWDESDFTAWPAAGSVDLDTLELLKHNDYTAVFLDSDNADFTGGPRITLHDGAISAVVTDHDLTAAVTQAISAPTEVEQRAGVATATAQLAAAAQNSTPGLVLAIDRATAAESSTVPETVESLLSVEWVDSALISELPEGAGSLRSGDTLEDRLELLRSAVKRETEVVSLSPLLEDPDNLSGYQRSRLLQLFATRYASPDSDFSAVAERYRERDTELLLGVQVIPSTHTQLVGTSSRVPIQVHNSLPFNAVIAGEARPSSAGLSVSERKIEATAVPADGNQTLLIPVHTRISSGESGLILNLTDTTGEISVFNGTIPISISSAIESIALSVLGVLTATLLGFGVWRSIRRRRKQLSTPHSDPEHIRSDGE